MSRLRDWFGLGPSRAELVADAERWHQRCLRSNAARDEAYARIKTLRGQVHDADLRVHAIRAILADRLSEPTRITGCDKVRFHREDEAVDWLADIARNVGQPEHVFHVYDCKTCPRSPVTMARYFHVGHTGSARGQAAKAAGKARDAKRRAEAEKAGRLLRQRVDPRVLARLVEIRNAGSNGAGQ